MNPRPQTFHLGVYILIPDFDFRLAGLLRTGSLVAYPMGFNRVWHRHPESAVLLVDAPSRVAGLSRWNGSCLSSYGVVIIVCDYMFSRRFTSGQESSTCSQCFFAPVEPVSPPNFERPFPGPKPEKSHACSTRCNCLQASSYG